MLHMENLSKHLLYVSSALVGNWLKYNNNVCFIFNLNQLSAFKVYKHNFRYASWLKNIIYKCLIDLSF